MAKSRRSYFKSSKPTAAGSPKAPEAPLVLEGTEEVMTEPKAIVNLDSVENFEETVFAEEDMAMAALPPQESVSEITAKAMLSVAESVRTLVENQQLTKQLTMGEIKPVSPWNPEGKRQRLALKRSMYMHGLWQNPLTMTEEEIELANQLKPGRYIGRRVEVQQDGMGNINIDFPWLTVRERMENQELFKNFADLASQCIAERKAKEEKRKAGLFDPEEVIN